MSSKGFLLLALCAVLTIALGACPKPKQGSLAVHLQPEEAVAAGAQWRVDGGAWQQSGATVDGLAPGQHTVDFAAAAGWYTPEPVSVAIRAGETASLTQAYLRGHDDWQADEFTYDVVLAPEVTYVDESHLDILLEADLEDEDEQTFEFDAAGAAAAGLVFAEGNPLLIHGLAARRIASVTESGGTVLVETEFIALNEIIADGEVAWDYGVEFTPEKVYAVVIDGKRFVLTADDNVIHYSFEIGAYKYTIHVELAGVTANVEFTVEKGLAGSVKGRLVAKGTITRFRNRDTMRFGGGELQEYGHDLTGMRGDVTLELVVTASGADFVDYKLPVPILEFPFAVGPVPVVLSIGAQFVINASVPADGSSRVTTGFAYDSNLGFSFNGVSLASGGSLAGLDLAEGVTETGASGAISANFGIGFPRVQLSIFGNTLVPWAQTACLIGGSYTFTPPCQTADALFLGAAGFDLKFLGFPLFSGSRTFFERKEPLLRAGDCPEDRKVGGLLRESVWLITDEGWE